MAASPREAAACRRCQFPSSAFAHRTSRPVTRTAPTGAYMATFAAYNGLRVACTAA